MTAYLITVIIAAIMSTAVAAVTIYCAVRLIMRRVKHYHSINLVELKGRKLVYWIFAGVIGVLIIYLIMQMAGAKSSGTEKFIAQYGVDRPLALVAFTFPLLAMTGAEFLIVMLGIGKSAVVDKGVHTGFSMLDWHRVHDYVIDEERGILMLTADKRTFSTLRHLTTPFKVKKADIEKLKFILNKNKNKFSSFDNN